MIKSLLSLFFPPKCPVCKEKREREEPLCSSCRKEYEKEKYKTCPRCNRTVSTCRCRPRYENDAVFCYLSVFRYKESTPGGRMILRIKDGKNKAVTELLAKDMAKSLQKGCILRQDALVTFVPRAEKTRLEKGTDQARELAEALGDLCGLEVAVCLDTARDGRVQKDLNVAKRMENALDLYKIKKNCPDLSGKQVILVDDVLTSGATMNACAALLKSAGAGTVVCLTAGRR